MALKNLMQTKSKYQGDKNDDEFMIKKRQEYRKE